MELDTVLLWLHVIGAAVLFGTGSGIAFFMAMAHRTGRPEIIAHVAGVVVVADGVFTASAAVLQPATGVALAVVRGWPLTEGWIVVSAILYILVGVFWLPVVWIQRRMRDLARHAAAAGQALPASYYRLYGIWRACGIPAFAAVLAIFWLMLAKPAMDIP